jgi:hypothetical protein
MPTSGGVPCFLLSLPPDREPTQPVGQPTRTPTSLWASRQIEYPYTKGNASPVGSHMEVSLTLGGDWDSKALSGDLIHFLLLTREYKWSYKYICICAYYLWGT